MCANLQIFDLVLSIRIFGADTYASYEEQMIGFKGSMEFGTSDVMHLCVCVQNAWNYCQHGMSPKSEYFVDEQKMRLFLFVGGSRLRAMPKTKTDIRTFATCDVHVHVPEL